MSKLSLAGVSLLAAIPGGFLAYVLVMGMVDHFDKMGGMVKVVAIFSLLLAVAGVMLLPGAFVFGPKSPDAKPKDKKKPEADDTAGAIADEDEGFETAGEDADDLGAESETIDMPSEELAEADDDMGDAVTADALDSFDVEEDSFEAEDDSFVVDDDDEDEKG